MGVWKNLNGEKKTVDSYFREGFITTTEIKLVSNLQIYLVQQSHFNNISLAWKNNKRHCLEKQLGLKTDQFEFYDAIYTKTASCEKV